MPNIWFTVDWHIDHVNIIKHCKRPHKTVVEMNEAILENFHSRVKHGDTVYYLGDLCWGGDRRVDGLLAKFPPETYFILGNHDYRVRSTIRRLTKGVQDLQAIKVKGQDIVLCHYAMRVWHKSHYGAWQLYAHSHGSLAPRGLQHDVGVDNTGFAPLHFDQIEALMKIKLAAQTVLGESRNA